MSASGEASLEALSFNYTDATRTQTPNTTHYTKQALRAKPMMMNLVISLLLISSVCHQATTSISSDNPDNQSEAFEKFGRDTGRPLALVYSDEKPRLIPLVAAESGYSENSSVNILCTVSQGHHDTLTFDWFKDGQMLINHNEPSSQIGGGLVNKQNADEQQTVNSNLAPPQIEKHSDHSLLRISRVYSQHSGRYTCAAKNQFGQDSSSVNLIVNVKLQWIKEPPKEVVVSVNQELKVDCMAQGEPRPSMRWEKLDSSSMGLMPRARAGGVQFHNLAGQTTISNNNAGDSIMMAANSMTKNQLATKESNGYKLASQQQQQHHHSGFVNSNGLLTSSQNSILISSNRHLNIQRAKESDAGIYECIASNSHDADLRKLVHVQVRGPPKILPIATADSYPEGSSINLICTVSGGQRRGLVLSWMMNGEDLDEQRLKYSGAGFDNLSIGKDDADISILRIKNATNVNSGQYTCTAKNPLGQDSTSVKIVINVELKWNKIPKDVEVGLNQELTLECDAVGQPQPTIEWVKHSTHMDRNSNGTMVVSKNKLLKLSKAQYKDSGLYECIAKNGVDEDLRKVIQVKVRDKIKRQK